MRSCAPTTWELMHFWALNIITAIINDNISLPQIKLQRPSIRTVNGWWKAVIYHICCEVVKSINDDEDDGEVPIIKQRPLWNVTHCLLLSHYNFCAASILSKYAKYKFHETKQIAPDDSENYKRKNTAYGQSLFAKKMIPYLSLDVPVHQITLLSIKQ